jgi:hypothetical protein
MFRKIEDSLHPHEVGSPLTLHSIGWSRHVNIRTAVKAEFSFSLKHINQVHGQPFQRQLIHCVLDIDLDTDASQKGWGAILYLPDPEVAPDPIILTAARQNLPPTIAALFTALQHCVHICGTFSIIRYIVFIPGPPSIFT